MRSAICLVVATFAVWLSMQGPAEACSCLAPDMNRSYNDADQVLHVRVLGSIPAARGQRRHLGVTIKQAFKGCLADGSLVVIQTASDSAACGLPLQAGTDYLLYGRNSGRALGLPVLQVGLCDANSAWSALEPAQLAFLNTRFNCCGDACACVGSSQVECFVDPCQVSSCDVEGAVCNANYCGGCNAEWIDATGARVCLPTATTCDDPVQCLVDPCQVSSCDVKGATCTANYCGGCNAIWTDPNGTQVCLPTPTVEPPCKIGGCSAELCIGPNDSGVSSCIARKEYACYHSARCEPQARGLCGWTQTPELSACIEAARQ